MQHKHILFATIAMLLLASTATGSEQIWITSPSSGPIAESVYEAGTVKLYFETASTNASRPYWQAENNLGSWEPSNQIDQHTYLAYWDISDVSNGDYSISAKAVIDGTEYYDMVTVSIEWPDTTSTTTTKEEEGEVEEEEEEKELDVFGLDTRTTIGQASDVYIRDDETKDPVPDVQIKIKNKKDGTILRTQSTDEYGRAYVQWDIVGDYTIGISHPDYDTTSETVYVVPVQEVTTAEPAATATESEQEETVVQEVARDPTQEEIQQYIEDTKILGDSQILTAKEIQDIKSEAVYEYTQNQPAATTAEPHAASFEGYALPFSIVAVLILIIALLYNKFKDPTRMSSDRFNNMVSSLLNKGQDDFDPDAYSPGPAEDSIIATDVFSEQPEQPAPQEAEPESVPVIDTPVFDPDSTQSEPVAAESEAPQPPRDFMLTPDEAKRDTTVISLAEDLANIGPDQTEDVNHIVLEMANVICPYTPEDEFEQLQIMRVINQVLKNKLAWVNHDPFKKQNMESHIRHVRQEADSFLKGGAEPAPVYS